MKNDFKIIGFDADDTLWINEPYFQETENQFCELLSSFQPADAVSRELFRFEMQNLELYGYGAKSFMLSMIETALHISGRKIEQRDIEKIIELGRTLLNKPVVLLDGVREVLDYFDHKKIKMVVATKGDLLDQERKLRKSGIGKYFHHVEIMSDKKESDYRKLLKHLDIQPGEFLMIGNSLKSDILPVLNIGGSGVHVPYHTTWQYENIESSKEIKNYTEVEHISELIEVFEQ